jgi:hypothetical protein
LKLNVFEEILEKTLIRVKRHQNAYDGCSLTDDGIVAQHRKSRQGASCAQIRA